MGESEIEVLRAALSFLQEAAESLGLTGSGVKQSAGESRYRRDIRNFIGVLWQKQMSQDDFVDTMTQLISVAFDQAWKDGAAMCGVKPDEYSDEEKAALEKRVAQEASFLPAFAQAIVDVRDEEGLKVNVMWPRADGWALRYGQVKTMGQTMACADEKTKWVYGDTIRHCLPGDAMVLTSDGERRIDGMSPGNYVLTRDGWRVVEEVFKHKYNGRVVTVGVGGRSLTVTGDHPVMTQRGWVRASELVAEQDAVTLQDGLDNSWTRSTTNASLMVYNLEVDESPEFFANGILVHNCADCSRVEGRVYRNSVWAKYGWQPGSSDLACQGFRCRCTLDPTDEPVTSGRPPSMRGPKRKR